MPSNCDTKGKIAHSKLTLWKFPVSALVFETSPSSFGSVSLPRSLEGWSGAFKLFYFKPFYSPPLENKTRSDLDFEKKIIIMDFNYSYFQPWNSNAACNEFSKSGNSLN